MRNVTPATVGHALVSLVLAGLLGAGTAEAAPTTAPPGGAIAPPIDQSAGAIGQCSAPADQIVPDLPWAQRRLAPQRVWPLTRGEGVTVAVIDSGVDASVPQLAGHVLPGTDVVSGRGRADDDCLGHGTFVAGIIAAQQTSGVGFAGVAPGVTILPIRQTTTGADGAAAGLAKAITVAVDARASVINISVASFQPSAELQAAVDYAAAKNVVVVAAAANSAQQGNPTAYPAAYPSVIAVAAVGADGARADFSEAGGYLAVAAPGVGVLSTGPRGPGHMVGSGTSYAAPFVAGVAALIRAYHPALTAAQTRHRIEVTADPPAGAVPDPGIGWGIVNPYTAVTAVLPEEQGVQVPKAAPRQVAAPVYGSRWDSAGELALLVAGLAVVLVFLVVAASVLAPRAHRRRWRHADRGPRESVQVLQEVAR